MATVDLTVGGTTGHPASIATRNPYIMSTEVTGAAAAAAKGGVLDALDVIQVFDIPADTVVIYGGAEITTADTDGSADALVSLGTGVDVDQWVAAVTLDVAAILTTLFAPEQTFAAADTVDLALTETTAYSSNDDWVMNVWVLCVDITNRATGPANPNTVT